MKIVFFVLLAAQMVYGYEFEGSWTVEDMACQSDGRPYQCAYDYKVIETKYSASPAELCVNYRSQSGGGRSECLSSFDYSRPELGLTFEAKLILTDDNTKVLYKMNQSNRMQKTLRGIVIAKRNSGQFTLMEVNEVENSLTGDSTRDEILYTLSHSH